MKMTMTTLTTGQWPGMMKEWQRWKWKPTCCRASWQCGGRRSRWRWSWSRAPEAASSPRAEGGCMSFLLVKVVLDVLLMSVLTITKDYFRIFPKFQDNPLFFRASLSLMLIVLMVMTDEAMISRKGWWLLITGIHAHLPSEITPVMQRITER